MEVRVNIEYEEVLRLVRQLPFKKKKKLFYDINRELDSKKEEVIDNELKEFREFLLNGPVMSDDQFSDFQNLRKDFARWLEK